MLTAFDVIHQGVSKKMVEFLKGHRTGNMTVREMVNLVGTIALDPRSKNDIPSTRSSPVKLTTANLGDAVADGIRCTCQVDCEPTCQGDS